MGGKGWVRKGRADEERIWEGWEGLRWDGKEGGRIGNVASGGQRGAGVEGRRGEKGRI